MGYNIAHEKKSLLVIKAIECLMGLDDFICSLPFLGSFFKRLYSYFRKHILFTDLIHIMIGLGLGLIIASRELFIFGIVLIVLGGLGHLYAFVKG